MSTKKEAKNINITPSNKYFAEIADGISTTYTIIDAVAVIVYYDLSMDVGGLDLGVESGCCGNNIVDSLYKNLKPRLFSDNLEKYITHLTSNFSIDRKESVYTIYQDFKSTDIIIMPCAMEIFNKELDIKS